MHTSLTCADLVAYTLKQTDTFFPDGANHAGATAQYFKHALDRLEHCFSRIANRYFATATGTRFDHLHSDQYAMFLYFVSNTISRMGGDPILATKLYLLNKALHGIDIHCEVALPEIFFFQHPLGTVLGRATYSDYLVVYQRCTIGGSPDLVYPVLGEGVVMFAGSGIIGTCKIGNNCWLSTKSVVMNEDLHDDCVVFGSSPNLVVKKSRRSVLDHYFQPAVDPVP